jgi:hypothetical protein
MENKIGPTGWHILDLAPQVGCIHDICDSFKRVLFAGRAQSKESGEASKSADEYNRSAIRDHELTRVFRFVSTRKFQQSNSRLWDWRTFNSPSKPILTNWTPARTKVVDNSSRGPCSRMM